MEKQEPLEAALKKVVKHAWKNERFKQELIDNPIAAIKTFTGRELDLKEGMKFKVTDQSDPFTIYFNIPSNPNLEDVELNEEQLELVAGGGFLDNIRDAIEKIKDFFPTPFDNNNRGL